MQSANNNALTCFLLSYQFFQLIEASCRFSMLLLLAATTATLLPHFNSWSVDQSTIDSQLVQPFWSEPPLEN
jgi:hypothetical protein